MPDVAGVVALVELAPAAWVLDKILDQVWARAVRPAFERVFGQWSRRAGQSSVFRFGIWYGEDAVYSVVEAVVAPGDDPTRFVPLIEEGQRQALRFIEEHGITRQTIARRVEAGAIVRPPEQ